MKRGNDTAQRAPEQVMAAIAGSLSPGEAARCAEWSPDEMAAGIVRAVEHQIGERLTPMEILGLAQHQLSVGDALMRLAEGRADEVRGAPPAAWAS